MAPRNSYTLDGVPLTNIAAGYFLDSETGIRFIPAKRMANIAYPAVDGNSFLPGAPFIAGGVAVVMNVFGKDHQEFMERVEFINGLFLQRHKLLELRHDYNVAGTVSRHAFVTCTNSSTVDFEQGVKSAKINFTFDIPGTFWRSATTLDYLSPPVTAVSVTRSIPSLNGGNAPVSDALIRVKGAFSTMAIMDDPTNSQIIINTPLAAGEYIIIDPANWTARKVIYDTWVGGTVVDSSVISNRGMGSMITFEPSIVAGTLQYSVAASATNPSDSPTFEIRAKKSYL